MNASYDYKCTYRLYENGLYCMSKKCYLRTSKSDDLKNAQYLVLQLAGVFSSLTIDAPISPHQRGGFILPCTFDDVEIEAIARF